MKIAGIVAEYNPFHNGHMHHVNETKKVHGCDAIVAVVSGNFIQRGQPALFDKWTRTKMALESGVDLIIELPVYYATSSAEYFASGSISLLNKLGVIDYLSFGNRCNDIDILNKIANVLNNEPAEYQKILQSELKRGLSFPTARSNALRVILKKDIDEKILSDILLDSNNILGIEYLKALSYLNSNIQPISVERIGVTYNSIEISGNICSATAIREMFRKQDLSELPNVVPEPVFRIIQEELTIGKNPMFHTDFEKELFYILRMLSPEEISNLADVTEGLENIIKKGANEYVNIDELIDMIKSKRYTKTRIQRILIHALLNITKEDLEYYKYSPQYIRVLGFNKTGEKILSKISVNSDLPIVTSVSKFMKNADESQKKMIEKDILATNIYTLGYQIPPLRDANLDYTNAIVTK